MGALAGAASVCDDPEPSQGLLADMMLDAFRIGGGGFFVDTDRQQEPVDGVVPFFAGGGEPPAFGSQFDGPIRLGGDQLLSLETLDRLDHGDMRDPETVRKVGDTTCARVVDDLRDGFDVILGDLGGVVASCALIG